METATEEAEEMMRLTGKAVWWVYAFAQPLTHEVRYVGCARDPYKRMQSHMCAAHVHNKALADWIKSLRKSGGMPEVVILEKVPFAKHCRGDRERYWVEKYHADGADLFNKQLNPTHSSPLAGVLNPNSHAGQIRLAFDKLGWNAPARAVQKEVGPRVHYFEMKNCRWNGFRWTPCASRKYLLPLSYINAIRQKGVRVVEVPEGT